MKTLLLRLNQVDYDKVKERADQRNESVTQIIRELIYKIK